MSIHFDPKITTNPEGQIKNTSIENENKISIFTDINNNGIVDESDFNNNEKMLNVVNSYNLLGKKWKEVKDIINHIATMKNSLEQNNVVDIYIPLARFLGSVGTARKNGENIVIIKNNNGTFQIVRQTETDPKKTETKFYNTLDDLIKDLSSDSYDWGRGNNLPPKEKFSIHSVRIEEY